MFGYAMKNNLKILAIETSCDETAAAVIGEENSRPVILSNIISSQIDLHAKTGGVVPEVASRAHMEAIVLVVSMALIQSVGDEFLISNQFPINSQFDNETVKQSNNEEYQKAIKILRDEIDYIAVTAGPGLIGSLLIGFNAAKSIAYALDKQIIPINHIEGHIYSALASRVNSWWPVAGSQLSGPQTTNHKPQATGNWKFPTLALTVSGGHTSLTLMKDHGVYEQIGATLDDAVGEAYDKVARLLNLGYPGGPAISKLAEQFRNKFPIINYQLLIKSQLSIPKNKYSNVAIKQCSNKEMPLDISFPRPIMNDDTFNFSFSGLKTAVLVWVKKYLVENKLDSVDQIQMGVKEEVAAAFEEAIKDVLATKTMRAVKRFKPKAVVFAGGVSANQYLRSQIELGIKNYELGIGFLTPSSGMFGDNAAMIGLAAYHHIKRGDTRKWNEIEIDSNLEL